ncbi:MAG TPA: hypothetical protein VMG82_13580 [Candidatus Sulfotelmatobacter sp.]|nr:hypothetical protein [Candidatus Sulfotelmatobacter sp.]
MLFGFVNFANACLAAALAALALPRGIFWLYFSASILLIVGLVKILKSELPKMRGLDKILPFGRLFFTIPLAVFGTEHFTNTADIAALVPRWIPGHLFWTYLVGTCLIAAALSITVEIQSPLAATLLGAMFFSFVCLMDIPGVIAEPGNRFSWTLALRETAFSAGGLAYAGAHWSSGGRRGVPWLVTIARFFIAIPAVFYGVEHFPHPMNAPGVPLEKIMPPWIPGRPEWAYLAGIVLVVAGIALLINKKAQMAATYLGIMILLLMAFVYLPLLVSSPTSLESINYFFDTLLFGGAIFVLADALRERTAAV